MSRRKLRSSKKEQGLLIKIQGSISSSGQDLPVTVGDWLNEISTSKLEDNFNVILPRVSLASSLPRVLNKNKGVIKSNIDFSSYLFSTSRIASDIEGNCIFITKSFGLTAQHVIGSNTYYELFFEHLERYRGVELNRALKSFCKKFKLGGDLELVQLPENFEAPNVMVPEIPPPTLRTEGVSNVFVIGHVPKSIEIDTKETIVTQQVDNNKEERIENMVVKEKIRFSPKMPEIENCFSNHNKLIISYGYSSDNWINAKLEHGHSCTTFSGFSGSAVRFVAKDDYLIFPDENIEVDETKEKSECPIFHGVHTHELTFPALNVPHPLNQCLRTDSLPFIWLYAIAIYLEKKEPIFPSTKHINKALAFMEDAEKMLLEKPETAVTDYVLQAIALAKQRLKSENEVH
ncbi:hypothetical protein ABK040_009861 [Willaertia magna]